MNDEVVEKVNKRCGDAFWEWDKEDIARKVNELVEEWNIHKEWHKRFFDKYSRKESK